MVNNIDGLTSSTKKVPTIVNLNVGNNGLLRSVNDPSKAFIYSCHKGEVANVEMALKKGGLSQEDKDGALAIAINSYACELSEPEKSKLKNIIKLLVDNGANVNCIEKYKGMMDGNITLTPVIIPAASSGDLDIVKYLVEHGADVNAKAEKIFGDPQTEKNNNREPVATSLVAAVESRNKKGSTAVVQYLIDKGADVNQERVERKGWGVLSESNWTPLMSAVKNGDLKIVKMLIDHGAKIDAESHGVGTEVHSPKSAAQKSGNKELIKLFGPKAK